MTSDFICAAFRMTFIKCVVYCIQYSVQLPFWLVYSSNSWIWDYLVQLSLFICPWRTAYEGSIHSRRPHFPYLFSFLYKVFSADVSHDASGQGVPHHIYHCPEAVPGTHSIVIWRDATNCLSCRLWGIRYYWLFRRLHITTLLLRQIDFDFEFEALWGIVNEN